MKKRRERSGDLPKVMACIMVSAPNILLRTAFAYRRVKKRARKSVGLFEARMVREGMPPELARALACDFQEDLSLREMVKSAIADRLPEK